MIMKMVIEGRSVQEHYVKKLFENPETHIVYYPVVDTKAEYLMEFFQQMGVTEEIILEPSEWGNVKLHGDQFACKLIPPMFTIDMDDWSLKDRRTYGSGNYWWSRREHVYPIQAVKHSPSIVRLFRQYNGLEAVTSHYLHSKYGGSTMFIEELTGSIDEQWSQLWKHENRTGYFTDWCDKKPAEVKRPYAGEDGLENMFHFHMD